MKNIFFGSVRFSETRITTHKLHRVIFRVAPNLLELSRRHFAVALQTHFTDAEACSLLTSVLSLDYNQSFVGFWADNRVEEGLSLIPLTGNI